MKQTLVYGSVSLGIIACCFQIPVVLGEEMSCEYTSNFDRCKIANKNGSTRSIEDFICVSSSSDEVILDQIILDAEFEKVDVQIESYLDALSKDKEASLGDTNRVIDDITKNLLPEGIYYREFKSLCDGGLLAKRAECTGSIPNISAGERIKGSESSTQCMNLVNNKMDIYARVAFDTMKLNKSDVRKSSFKEDLVQEIRTKYDKLITMMADILGFVGRIARGLTHYTPNPKQ